MTDTTPTPADRPADQLRAAAEKLRSMDPLTADRLTGIASPVAWWLEWQAAVLAEGQTAALDPALAVARQLLGTSAAEGDRRCVCGDPIEWMTHPDGPGWIHSPGADTRCLDARPAAAPPAPVDRAAHYREAAEVARQLGEDMGEIAAPGARLVADRLRRLADDAAAGVQPPTTTADRAAALGMTPTEYRQHSHNTAVQQIQAATQGLFAGTAIRVADALKEPATPPAAPAAPEEQR